MSVVDSNHSILIVTASEQLRNIVKRSLRGFLTIDERKSASMARRCILERTYDLIVIDTPLSDEIGDGLALDIAEKSNSSVLLITPRELYDELTESLTDHGIMVVAKPFPTGSLDKSIRYLTSLQNRIHALEKRNLTTMEKMEELRIVSKAKVLLVEKKNMTEDEAHRYIGKMAMDNGVSRRRAAEELIDRWSPT